MDLKPEPGTPAALADLLKSAREGSAEALGQVLETFRRYLLSVAEGQIADDLRAKAGASDVVQDTLLEAYRLFDRFVGDQPEEVRAWLRAILLNKLAEFHRYYQGTQKRQAGRECSIDAGGASPGLKETLPADTSSPSGTAARNEEADRLAAALERLPERHRRVIRLRNWENRPFGEIGSLFGVSEDAARMLWTRAIVRLQEEMERSP